MEGLLSTGPTPSSFYVGEVGVLQDLETSDLKFEILPIF